MINSSKAALPVRSQYEPRRYQYGPIKLTYFPRQLSFHWIFTISIGKRKLGINYISPEGK